jgi:hypothetical protein
MTAQNANITEISLHSNIIATDLIKSNEGRNEGRNNEFMLLNTIRWMTDNIKNYNVLNGIPADRQNDYASYSDAEWALYIKAINQNKENTKWINIITNYPRADKVTNIDFDSGEMTLDRLLELVSAAAVAKPNAGHIVKVLEGIKEKQNSLSIESINKFIASSCQSSKNMNNSSKNNMSMLLTSVLNKDRKPKGTFITLGKKRNDLYIHEMTYYINPEEWIIWRNRVNRKYQNDINDVITLYGE